MNLRRHATTIALTVAAIVALVFVLFVDRGTVSTNEATMRKRNLFDAWREADVTAVTVRSKGRVARLVRAPLNDAGQRPWDVEIDGVRHAAEEQAADQLLGSLEFAVAERRVAPEAVDTKAMGLEAPGLTVEVSMGVLGYALAVGGSAASPEGARYAEVKGKGVFVLSRELVAALDIRPEQLRSRHFVPYFSVDLARIELEGRGGARRLVRAPWSGSRSPSFRFDEGTAEGGLRVSAAGLDRLLGALADLSAEAFLTEDEANRSVISEITVGLVPRDADKPKASIVLGGACPKRPDPPRGGADGGDAGADPVETVVAVRSAPSRMAVCVPKAPVSALALSAEELVDHRLVGAPGDEVTEVKLTQGDRVVEIARSGAEWHVRRPEDRRADADAGLAFLGAILAVEATGFAPGHAISATSSARIVSLASGEQHVDGGHAERVEELTWGEPEGGDVYVRRAEDGAILVVPAARMAAFAASDFALRSRKVVDEVLSDVVAVRVQSAGRTQRLERRAGGHLELVEPKGQGLVADEGLASDLAQAIATLTADRWIADHDDGSHGLAPPRLVLSAEFRVDEGAPAREVKIDVGAATDVGYFATREGTPGVFVVPRGVVDAADRWLVDRGALAVPDASEIAGVTVERGASAKRPLLSIVRRGDGWVVEAGALPSGVDAAAPRDVIAELVAEGAVSLGKPGPELGLDPPSFTVRVARAGAPDAVLRFGAGDTLRGVHVVYARRDGVDATFAVARESVKLLLDAAGR